MKRVLLSCLTLVLALTFANAQLIVPDPPMGSDGVTPATQKGTPKHIYICKDELRPVDLSYDVLGVYADITKGKWVASHPEPFPTGYYDGTNVFKVQGTALGTYVFDFVVNAGITNYCNLDGDEYLRTYVHIVPNFNSLYDVYDAVCQGEVISVDRLKPENHIRADWKKLVEDAGGTFTSAPASWILNPTVLGVSTHNADITITLPAPYKYPCNPTFNIKLTLTVDTIKRTPAATRKEYCWDNVQSSTLFPEVEFNRTVGGTYAIQNHYPGDPLKHLIVFSKLPVPTPGTPTKAFFEYTYFDCKVNQTLVDTVIVYHKDDMNFPDATKNYCKPGDAADSVSLFNFYLQADLGGNVSLPMGTGWIYHGINAAGNHGSVPAPTPVNGRVEKDKLYSGTNYYFKFKIAPGDLCGANTEGTLIVKPKDGLASGDGRFQICRPAIGDPAIKVDLSAIMNITGATWTAADVVNSPAIASSEVTVVAATHNFTYRYNYVTAGLGVCDNSTGAFYLKVIDNIIVPDEITEKFCITSLPGSGLINLDYIAGTNSGTWNTAPGLGAYVTGGNIVKIGDLGANLGLGTYEFKLTKAGCLGHDVTVKIVITDDITL